MFNNDLSTTIYGEIEKDLPLVKNSLKELSDDIGFEFLEKMIEQSLSGSGKMMRPALALLAGKLGNYDLEKLIPLAASVELLHTASLVHDDVIDRADARRGNETSNILFGNAAAVMLGDYMFAYAAEFITRTDNIDVVKKFAATLMMMVQGELKQDVTVFEYSEDVQRYLDRITGKTASLFATAAEGGALVCDVPESDASILYHYGLNLGIAFQIVDDVLDFSGDPELMGKPIGSDLKSGTLTLPSILYMQQKPDDNPIKRAFEGQRKNSNLNKAISDILDGAYIKDSMETAQKFGVNARNYLATIDNKETVYTLNQLIDYVLERKI